MERIDGLNIVVAIDQDNGFAGHRFGFRVDEWRAITMNLLGFEASRSEFRFDPVRGLDHFGTFRAVCANARNAK